jgi:hypothetical protein
MATAEEKQAKMLEAARKVQEKADRMRAEALAFMRQQKQKASAQERKNENRRKILVGSMGLERAAKFEDYRERLLNDLDKFLTRDDDRALFKLGPVQVNTTAPEAQNTGQ